MSGPRPVLPAWGPFLVLALALSAALFWPYLTFQRLYLFTDIGSDTVQSIYPRLGHLAEYLRAWGLPRWSFERGMGMPIFGRDLGDPFNWVLLALGQDRLGYGIGWVEAAKVVVGGGVFHAYLGRLGLAPLARTVGGLCFAFSGFMIVGGGWYMFSTEAVYVALVLYAFERGFTGGRWGLLPVAFTLIALSQPFALYTTGLFLGAYATARCLAAGRPTLRLPALWGRLGGLALLGAAMGAVLLVSQVVIMAQSPRAGGEASYVSDLKSAGLFRPAPLGEFLTLLVRLFGNDLYGTGSGFEGAINYLEAPLLYVGLPALLLGPLAFFLLTRRERIAWGGLLAAFALVVAMPGLRHTFWLYLGDYYRVLGLFAGLCLLIPALLALDRIDRGARPRLVVLSAVFVTLLALLVLLPVPAHVVSRGVPRAVLAGFLLAYFAVLAGARRWGFTPVLRWGFVGLLVVELGLAARPAVDLRPVITAPDVARGELYGDDSARAAELVTRADTGFYRVSKPLRRGLGEGPAFNDAMVMGFKGTPIYDRFNQAGYIRFLGAVGAIDPHNEIYTRWAEGLIYRPLLEVLASVKYRLSPVGEEVPPYLTATYTARARVGDVVVMENTHFLPLGLAFDRYLTRGEYERVQPEFRDMLLLHAVMVDRPEEAAGHGLAPLARDLPLSINGGIAARRAEAMTLTGHTPNRIAGTIEVGGPRLLFFSIPFDPGWSARVDGRPARLTQVDAGLTGVYLESGRHTVVLEYHVPWLWTSAAVSVLACGAWGFLFLRRRGGSEGARTGRAGDEGGG